MSPLSPGHTGQLAFGHWYRHSHVRQHCAEENLFFLSGTIDSTHRAAGAATFGCYATLEPAETESELQQNNQLGGNVGDAQNLRTSWASPGLGWGWGWGWGWG